MLAAIQPPLVYLDTNIFIYAAEGAENVVEKITTLFTRFDAGELRSLTSEITLAEVLVKPLRQSDASKIAYYLSLIQTTGSLEVVPVTRQVVIESARLRAEAPSLKLPDAIHAATARLAGCTTFLTNDRRFEAVAGLPVLLLSEMA